MNHSAYKETSSFCREDNSLGILNMDNLKVFGDLTSDSFKNISHKNGANESGRSINDRLNNERMKALETIQKSQKVEVFKRPHAVSNKENSKSAVNVSSNNPSMQLDHTDYVPFRRPNTINISDLVTDETINLESSSSCPPSVSKEVKVSFEPTEITGRSTLYNKDLKNHKNLVAGGGGTARSDFYKTKPISVSDILASSFAPKARNLCDTLQSADITLDSNGRHSSACSSFSFSGSRSLPRTADMSLSKNTCTEESFNGGFGTFSFSSAGAGIGMDESENFEPGELMQSKLINDEISWAQVYAAIPAATLSEQAKVKASRNSEVMSNGFDSPSTSNSMIAGDLDFSVGNFFNMRSDNIWNIVKSKSPEKCRTPVALVDEDDNTVTTTTTSFDVESSSKISITPKIDNKTYTRVETLATPIEANVPQQVSNLNGNHESKDSGNSTDNSYLLSISAIDRALCNLDIQSDASGIVVSEQLLKQVKNSKSFMNTYNEPEKNEYNTATLRSTGRCLGTDFKMDDNEKKNEVDIMILENKENLDPESKHTSGGTTLCDTMSFSESLLNSSDMKNLQRSIAQPRSPLSPIDINAPNIRISQVAVDGGEEADNDEWPSTPIASNRRIRRKKSPRDKSPLSNNVAMYDLPDATTPVFSRSSRDYVLNNKNITEKEPKSMSSTRLDERDCNSNTGCDFGISPNTSNHHHSTSSLVVRSNTLCVPQGGSPRTVSPRLGNSPMSSPRSYHLSQVSSPTPSTLGYQSPNLDVTTNSDRQLLSAGAARKIVSSPVGSESSSTSSYATMQTYRSVMSGASGRSVSRCSSSSEFSHRDGKLIPLKVTNTELSWGSVKLRSDSRKSMQIKNIITKRLVIRIEVSGPGFQIVNSQRSNTISLHSQECRTISICFCPTVRGVAIGKLSFYAPNGAPTIGNSFLEVPLYGYGGNASIIAQNILIGPVGSPFVTMGDVCELAQPLERTVSFYNKGPLLGFAAVSIDSIGLMMPRLSDAFEIHPSRFLIPPKNVVHVRIVFRPKREEIRKIIKKMGNVLTLANMRVICGDEANRQRIRRLLSKMSEEERLKLSSSSLDMMWTKFPQESEMFDLHDIKENPNVSMDLLSFFRIHEILLTINHDNMDDTVEASSLFLADVDETIMFRTICAAADSPTPPSTLGTVDENYEEDDAERIEKSTSQGTWSVNPRILEIDLNKQMPITLTVHNGFKSRQFFEVVSNLKDVLSFTPSDGYLSPDGAQTDIKISVHPNFNFPTENVYIMVYMENERITVPIKIIK